MPRASVRTVDFHHRSGAVTPMLRKPAGLPSWPESKPCPAQVSSLHLQATPTPTRPQTSGHVLLRVWFVGRLPVRKLNWQCLFKMQMDLLEDLLDLGSTESEFLGVETSKICMSKLVPPAILINTEGWETPV